jgi:hypothetical protein
MIRVFSESKSTLPTMKTPQTSDALVQALRKLACEYNRKYQNDVLDSVAKAESRSTSLETYLREMSDMNAAKSGGHAELIALSEALGTKIRVVDIRVQNQPGIHYTDFEPSEAAMSSLGSHGISLLLRPGHYDYLT